MESTYLSQARMTIQEQTYAVKYLAVAEPTISKILFGARYCQIFELSEKNEWQETKIEGSVYIIERKEEPRNCILALSKNTFEKLLIPVVENLLLEKLVKESSKVHVLYLRTKFEGEAQSRTFCINFETPGIINEAFVLIEESKIKEGRRKQPKELKKELTDVLKILSMDEEFVEFLAERVAKLRAKEKAPA